MKKHNIPILRIAVSRLQELRDAEYNAYKEESQTWRSLNDCICRLIETAQRAEAEEANR